MELNNYELNKVLKDLAQHEAMFRLMRRRNGGTLCTPIGSTGPDSVRFVCFNSHLLRRRRRARDALKSEKLYSSRVFVKG